VNDLIPGGIYSLSNIDDGYFIFIKEYETKDLLIFKLFVSGNTLAKINNELLIILSFGNDEFLRQHFVEMNKDEFKIKCNGFMGVVKSWILDKLMKL